MILFIIIELQSRSSCNDTILTIVFHRGNFILLNFKMEQQKPKTLLEEFNKGQTLYSQLDDISSSDPKFKTILNEAIAAFEDCLILIEENSLFSENETKEDFVASSIKYLSVPYYLGELYQKTPTTGSSSDRVTAIPLLEKSKSLYQSFLKRCIKFEILSKADIISLNRQGPATPEVNREEKIRRFRREKEIQSLIQKHIQAKINRGISDDDVDDTDEERAVSFLLLETSALKAISGIQSLEQEIDILKHMSSLMEKNDGELPKRTPPEPKPSGPPLVIRDAKQFIKDNTFRPGWNLPTVSVEEAGEMDMRYTIEQDKKQKEKEKQKKTVKEFGDPDSDDDNEKVRKDRDWDNWKDDNPYGSGNTGTKGYKY
eukprot:TRINITY_DN7893_c0_g2_i1.p1 TRINITY_DN7893_c0_g2~~TRINITY_DN7893_c0_g2_i1.p1  ORF type:complete len:372 (+),score=77.86 TRINITY_DN7893_c0_g2_i1:630-1745(+)